MTAYRRHHTRVVALVALTAALVAVALPARLSTGPVAADPRTSRFALVTELRSGDAGDEEPVGHRLARGRDDRVERRGRAGVRLRRLPVRAEHAAPLGGLLHATPPRLRAPARPRPRRDARGAADRLRKSGDRVLRRRGALPPRRDRGLGPRDPGGDRPPRVRASHRPQPREPSLDRDRLGNEAMGQPARHLPAREGEHRLPGQRGLGVHAQPRRRARGVLSRAERGAAGSGHVQLDARRRELLPRCDGAHRPRAGRPHPVDGPDRGNDQGTVHGQGAEDTNVAPRDTARRRLPAQRDAARQDRPSGSSSWRRTARPSSRAASGRARRRRRWRSRSAERAPHTCGSRGSGLPAR